VKNPMPSADPLSQLKDIHTPDPISYWWPLAPGWWILAFLIIVGLVLLAIWLRKKIKNKPVLKQATMELDKLKEQQPSKQHLVNALHLFRRSAIYQLKHENVASMPLPNLANKLAKHHGIIINKQSLGLMDNSQYAPKITINQQTWHQLIDDIKSLINLLNKTRHMTWEANNV